jgi:LmbE family N-acetylglucosaminyl deacetylase
MTKILFGIFAHPDDEAFGPAATLLAETHAGTELHLICLTPGENGTNLDNLPNLGEIRDQEWRAAGKLLGATSMHQLGYEDGTLSNIKHVEITNKIENIVKETISDRDDVEIEFMSLDLNGFTGHIDHIVAARSSCLAFYRLREQGLPMSRVRLFCWSHENISAIDTGFVFMEAGRQDDKIDETVDAREQTEKVKEVMAAHYTQRNDSAWMLEKRGENIAINHFIMMN